MRNLLRKLALVVLTVEVTFYNVTHEVRVSKSTLYSLILALILIIIPVPVIVKAGGVALVAAWLLFVNIYWRLNPITWGEMYEGDKIEYYEKHPDKITPSQFNEVMNIYYSMGYFDDDDHTR